MKKKQTWIDWVLKIPGWIKTLIVFISAIAGFIIAYREYPSLYILLTTIALFLLIFSLLVYVSIAKRESTIHGGGQVFRFEKKKRYFAKWGIILLLFFLAGLIIYMPSRLYFASILTGKPIKVEGKAIAIVSGHWGSDTGSICPNGIMEYEVNAEIANLIRRNLEDKHLTINEFSEFDQDLLEYNGAAIIVLRTGTCEYINDNATGFYVTNAISQERSANTTELTRCLTKKYDEETKLPYFSDDFLDSDLSQYHSFAEVDKEIPIAIIQMGFLNLDAMILTEKAENVANGIADGISCYLEGELDSEIPIEIVDKGMPEERIYIYNIGKKPLDMTNWKLADQNGNEFIFPYAVLESNETLIIFTNFGLDKGTLIYHWNIDTSGWQSGDEIVLSKDVFFWKTIKSREVIP